MKLSDEELLSIVDAEFTSAMGTSGGQISIERAKAYDFYLSKKFGNEIDGQSQVVTSDVADVVDGLMPSLLRIFTTAENLVNFDPVDPEDMEAAQQESDYVNYVFFKQNPAFIILYNWFFDAMVQKNGIVKAWWDDSEVITTESYQGLTENELFKLLEDDELEPVERSEKQIQTVNEQTGQIIEDTVHDIVFRRVSKRGKARVDNVPPEEYRISSDSRALDPSDARMVGQERYITRSELISMGFDKNIVEDLPADSINIFRNEESIARRDKTDESRQTATNDHSQEEIRLREAYIMIDYEKDGRAELRQVFTAGNQVLSNEPVDRQPFHVISPQPLPHKHFGRAWAEKVMNIQEVSSTLLRQTLDNLYHTNNPGHAVWEMALGDNTMDDLLTTRVGRVARFTRPVSESWTPISVPFTSRDTFPMLEYQEKLKRDRTGINADSEGLSPEALKNIQSSVLVQANDLSKMKQEAVARIFTETGIKSLFLHIHELVLKHQQKDHVVQLRNKWVTVNPQSWRTRYDMTVNIGLGIGTREQNLLHLNAIWEKQAAAIQMGGLGSIVTGEHLFNTASQIVKNANLKNPELYFSPGKLNAQSDEQQKLAQEQLQVQSRQQELDAQKQKLDQEKAALEHQRKMQELEIKSEKEKNDFMIKLEEVTNKLTELELKYGQNVPGSLV